MVEIPNNINNLLQNEAIIQKKYKKELRLELVSIKITNLSYTKN